PLTRGTDLAHHRASEGDAGSPPHAGNGPGPPPHPRGRRGLIPARGERTPRLRLTAGSGEAHPRTRGTDWDKIADAVGLSGSSPHAGNGLLDYASLPGRARLIPARGERTGTRSRTQSACRAHPRTRGTDTSSVCAGLTHAGSSPHAGNGPDSDFRWRKHHGL